MKAVDASTMRSLDRRAIEEAGIPGETLMERAGAGAASAIAEFYSKLSEAHARRFVVLAGKGNNGGDAHVVARLLPLLHPGMALSLHSICEPSELSGDAAAMFAKLPEDVKSGMKLSLAPEDLREGDMIVDGLLGTGASGALREPFKSWIESVNASGLPVVSLDIPSGLNADDGSVATCAIVADLTACMALPKYGMLVGAGPLHCGRVKIVDIGMPQRFIEEAKGLLETTFASDVRPFLGREPFDAHKNSRGSVLVIGGSRLYPGAPLLSASAALKSGAGLVYAALPKGAEINGFSPNALILRKLEDGGAGFFNEASLPELRELLAKADAVVLGPGLSSESSCEAVIRAVVNSGLPALFDADALNLIAKNPSLLSGLNPNSVFTPHPGEMKRLAEGFKIPWSEDRASLAKAFAAKAGAVAVLKGCRSVVASPDGRCAVNGSGCPSLATAGSGDVLSGLAGALLARGFPAFDAARTAAFIHGFAGEIACPCGSRGLLADELPDLIVRAMREVSPLS